MDAANDLPKYARLEVERRWLVPRASMPPLSDTAPRLIEDRYLEGGHLRVRVTTPPDGARRIKLGKKYPPRSALCAPVVSLYLTEAEAAPLQRLPGRSSKKHRYAVSGGALDVYLEPAHSFAIFEVEFASPHEARSYVAPPFAGEEVTGQAAYTGYALAAG